MRIKTSLKVFAISSLLFSISLTALSQAPVTFETKATGKGRVTLNGRGVAGCLVLLWKGPSPFPEPRHTFTTKTGSDGSFRITAPVGSYYATVSAPGFVLLVDGKPSVEPRQWILNAGEETDALSFEIQPGAAITGRVTGADGKPMIETKMTLLPDGRAAMDAWRSQAETWSNARTDDRGIYRFYGVPPGVYRVAAGESLTAYASMGGRPALRRVFYPESLDETKEKKIEIKREEEVSGIDIKMVPAEPVFSVKGKIVDETTGQPIRHVTLGLRIYQGESMIGGRSGYDYSDANGEFEIELVPPGRYALYAPGDIMGSDIKGAEAFGESAIFDVVDADVSGIVLKTVQTAAVSGWMTLEDNNKSLAATLRGLSFFATTDPTAGGARARGGFQMFTVSPDGTFAINGLFPGKLRLNVQGSANVKVLRVEHNDSFEPVELKSGDHLDGLKVVLVEASAIVKGALKLANGSPPDHLKGTAGLYGENGPVAFVVIDEHGRFVIENVPAGSYRLIVNAEIPGMAPASTHNEQAITVVNGQVSEVVVTLDSKPSTP